MTEDAAGRGPKRDHAAEYRPIARAAEALDLLVERHFELDDTAGFNKDLKIVRDGLRTVTQDLSLEDRIEVMVHAMALRLTRHRMLVSARSAFEMVIPDPFPEDLPPDPLPEGGGVGGMGGPSVGKGKPKPEAAPKKGVLRRTFDRLKGGP